MCVSGVCLEQGSDAPLWVNGASIQLAGGEIDILEIDTRLCPTRRGGCVVEFAVPATGTCHAGEDTGGAPYALPAGTRCVGDGLLSEGGRCAGGPTLPRNLTLSLTLTPTLP